jgi:hypothetical protein
VKTAHIHSATCNLAQWLTRHGTPTIYRCFALPQPLYIWRQQSGKFWIYPRILVQGTSHCHNLKIINYEINVQVLWDMTSGYLGLTWTWRQKYVPHRPNNVPVSMAYPRRLETYSHKRLSVQRDLEVSLKQPLNKILIRRINKNEIYTYVYSVEHDTFYYISACSWHGSLRKIWAVKIPRKFGVDIWINVYTLHWR